MACFQITEVKSALCLHPISGLTDRQHPRTIPRVRAPALFYFDHGHTLSRSAVCIIHPSIHRCQVSQTYVSDIPWVKLCSSSPKTVAIRIREEIEHMTCHPGNAGEIFPQPWAIIFQNRGQIQRDKWNSKHFFLYLVNFSWIHNFGTVCQRCSPSDLARIVAAWLSGWVWSWSWTLDRRPG